MTGICAPLALSALLACVCTAPARASAAEGRPFGIASFSVQATRTIEVGRAAGVPGSGFLEEPYAFTQAAGHPDALTIGVAFDTEQVGASSTLAPTRDPEDVVIDLPPGLVANSQAVARCSLIPGLSNERCPFDTQVGVYAMHAFGGKVLFGPIVDVTPEAGQAAELALETKNLSLPMTGHIVRTAHGYGLAVVVGGLPIAEVVSVQTTLWGVPAQASHDGERGLLCEGEVDREWSCEGGGDKSGESPVPFLTMGSDCAAGAQLASVQADSWEEPGRYVQAQATLPGVTGCNLLGFAPSLRALPETGLADEALGLGLDVEAEAPQSEGVQAAATPPLRDASVTLPRGVSIDPAVAGGVRACAAGGPEGIDIPSGLNAGGEEQSPEEAGEGEEEGLDGLARLAPGHCPEASAIGSAEAVTPLLASPLQGRVYLAQPLCGGTGQAACSEADAADGDLFRIYVELGGVAEGARPGAPMGAGVIVKLAGTVRADPVTGQLTVTLEEVPQLPIAALELDLNGGPRALLSSPATCGEALTTSVLEPWSAPGTQGGLFTAGTPDADPSSFYEVTGCSGAFAPGFVAGTLTLRAGQSSAFTVSVTRADREPYLRQIQVRGPPGLSAALAGVGLCGRALADAGECPEASRVGAAIVAAGAGSAPLELRGSVYLTGPYEGAPFGLEIVVDAAAGPLDLGRLLVRARVDIDPVTAALTITSDSLPQILLGVPLRLRRFTLEIDRPGLIVNPTGCAPRQVEGTIAGQDGAAASVSSPFAVGGCAALGFKPRLVLSTPGRTSRQDGAGLHVKLVYPKAPSGGSEIGRQANLAAVKIDLPKQLVSRLATLEGACLAGVFEQNPAACPASSRVGTAGVSTPLLPAVGGASLRGPAYFVSHGGKRFPELVLVLQGDGVTVDLSGETSIDRAGVTSSTFRAIPDVPVEAFELNLPEGPNSALAANGKLCRAVRTVTVSKRVKVRVHGHMRAVTRRLKQKVAELVMPTALTAQNGAVIHRNTPIRVTGCPHARKARGAGRHALSS